MISRLLNIWKLNQYPTEGEYHLSTSPKDIVHYCYYNINMFHHSNFTISNSGGVKIRRFPIHSNLCIFLMIPIFAVTHSVQLLLYRWTGWVQFFIYIFMIPISVSLPFARRCGVFGCFVDCFLILHGYNDEVIPIHHDQHYIIQILIMSIYILLFYNTLTCCSTKYVYVFISVLK